MKFQSLTQIFKITEYKDGCVFKTKPVGYAWVTIGHEPTQDGNLIFSAISTSLLSQLNHKTNRAVGDDTPDMDITTLESITSK